MRFGERTEDSYGKTNWLNKESPGYMSSHCVLGHCPSRKVLRYNTSVERDLFCRPHKKCLSAHTHTHTYIYTHIHIHRHRHRYTHPHTHTHTRAHTHIHTHRHTHTLTSTTSVQFGGAAEPPS